MAEGAFRRNCLFHAKAKRPDAFSLKNAREGRCRGLCGSLAHDADRGGCHQDRIKKGMTMEHASIADLLKKRWYIVLPIVALLGGLIYYIAQTDADLMSILKDYGYYGILLLTFLEGETIVVLAGMMSKTLELDPKIIALCAFFGSFTSDQLMFSLGKYKGESVLKYFPRVARNADRAAALFKKYDTILILGFRFVYGVRNVTPILLGISGVSHLKFFSLNFIGASVWALSFTYGGLYIGDMFTKAMHYMGHGIFYLLGAVALIGGGIWYLRSRASTQKAIEIARRTQQDAEAENTTQTTDDSPSTK